MHLRHFFPEPLTRAVKLTFDSPKTGKIARIENLLRNRKSVLGRIVPISLSPPPYRSSQVVRVKSEERMVDSSVSMIRSLQAEVVHQKEPMGCLKSANERC